MAEFAKMSPWDIETKKAETPAVEDADTEMRVPRKTKIRENLLSGWRKLRPSRIPNTRTQDTWITHAICGVRRVARQLNFLVEIAILRAPGRISALVILRATNIVRNAGRWSRISRQRTERRWEEWDERHEIVTSPISICPGDACNYRRIYNNNRIII